MYLHTVTILTYTKFGFQKTFWNGMVAEVGGLLYRDMESKAQDRCPEEY
jgi:hypothetical protein